MALLDVLQFLSDSGPVIDWTISPWRYLFSSDYRKQKRETWRGAPFRRFFDVLGGFCALLFGIGLVWFGFYLLTHWPA